MTPDQFGYTLLVIGLTIALAALIRRVIKHKSMEEKKDYLCTFRFYDDRKRRLSIFAEKVSDVELKVTIFTCSKKDMFSKKEARRIYEAWNATKGAKGNGMNPKITFVPIKDGKAKASFNKYCNNSFLKMEKFNITMEATVLVNEERGIVKGIYARAVDVEETEPVL